MTTREAYKRAAIAGRILQTGRFELARLLLHGWDLSTERAENGLVGWVLQAAVDLTVPASFHHHHEGVLNYYRKELGYPHLCTCPRPEAYGDDGKLRRIYECRLHRVRFARGSVRYSDGI